jgi:NAD(P)H dehydrogenase (quinone)
MKHAVILAHPSETSFTATIAETWCAAARSAGHEVALRDLYRIGFDPCLQDSEIPRPTGFTVGDDVKAEREIIGGADLFVFVYPLWFYAPPAMLKGYIDRVFGMGFGYGPQQQGGNQPLLEGRKMLSFTASGAPSFWVEERGDLAAIRKLFDEHVAGVCGMRVIDHVHFGGIVPELRKEAVEHHQATARTTFAKHFGALQ